MQFFCILAANTDKMNFYTFCIFWILLLYTSIFSHHLLYSVCKSIDLKNKKKIKFMIWTISHLNFLNVLWIFSFFFFNFFYKKYT